VIFIYELGTPYINVKYFISDALLQCFHLCARVLERGDDIKPTKCMFLVCFHFAFALMFVCIHFHFSKAWNPPICSSCVRWRRTMWSPTVAATWRWVSFELQWLRESPSTVVCDKRPPKTPFFHVNSLLVVCTRRYMFLTNINLRLSILHLIWTKRENPKVLDVKDFFFRVSEYVVVNVLVRV